MGAMDKEQSFKLLDAFVDAGGNFIDTACNYQNEESERWIGEWMKERNNRDLMVICDESSQPIIAAGKLARARASTIKGTTERTSTCVSGTVWRSCGQITSICSICIGQFYGSSRYPFLRRLWI